jgi:hypothetical protein
VVRFALPVLALAAGIAVAVGLVSCGTRDEKGLLPGNNAQQIVDNLNQVEQDTANGDCEAAAAHADEVRSQIETLGNDVNAQLKQRLIDGVDRLQTLITNECVPTATTPTVEPTTESTTSTTSTKEKSTTTSTQTTSTTSTPTAPTTPTTGEGGGVGPAPPGQTTSPGTGTGEGVG